MSLAIFARDSNSSPSRILDITDPLTAFEFDAVCSYLLQNHENARESKKFEILIKSFAVIMGADAKKVFADDEKEPDEEDVW